MDKDKWDEREIESLLRELPKIADERSKEDVLNRLKADERISATERKTQKSFKWIPVGVAIAAVFFVMILWPPLQGNESKQDIVSESSADDGGIVNEEAELFSDNARTVDGMSHVVVEDALGVNDMLIPMNLVSDGQVVPVTFIVSAEQVATELSGVEVTDASLYKRYVEEVDIRSLGFDAVAEKVNEAAIVSYFKYIGENGHSYLIPKARADLTAEDALVNMATRPDEEVEAVIPDSIRYHVTVQDEIALIRFEEVLELSTLEHEDAMMLLEGFMLTAEQFNLAVQFENISPVFWDTYDLTKPLPKPIASNPLYDLYE